MHAAASLPPATTARDSEAVAHRRLLTARNDGGLRTVIYTSGGPGMVFWNSDQGLTSPKKNKRLPDWVQRYPDLPEFLKRDWLLAKRHPSFQSEILYTNRTGACQ